MKVVKYQPAK